MEYEVKNKESFHFLSSFAQDAIIQIDENGLIAYWNKAAEILFGLSENKVLNKSFHQLFVPEQYLEPHNKAFAEFSGSGQGAAINKTLELAGKRKNGEEFPIELSLSSFQVNGKWNAVGIIRDITKRKEVENKNKERIKELTCLYGLTKIAGEKKLDIDTFLEEAINLIPPAWQFPELVYTKITVEGKEYKTKNFKETKWSQISKIYIENQKIGEIQVGYLEETPIYDEGSFLKEERNLINGISKILSGVLELKLTEEKLKQSETKNRNIINNLDVAFYQVLLGGKLLNHNPTFNFILGYDTALDLKNTNVNLLWVNPERREVYLEQLLSDGYVKNYVCHVLKKDGTEIILQLNSHVVRDKEDTPFRIDGTFIEVTENYILEQKLKESEENFRTITEDSHLGITILQNYMVVYTNQKVADMYGYDREEMLAWTPKEYAKTVAEDSLELVMEHERKKHIGDSGVQLQINVHCIKSSGEKFWVNNTSTTIMYKGRPAELITTIDITEKREAEEKLKRTFETTLKVLETLPMGIILVDDNGTIASVNKAALSLLGYSDEFEILNKDCSELTCPTENLNYLSSGVSKSRKQMEVYLKHKSGNDIPVLKSVLPITLGDINYSMETFVDITLLKDFQNQLKESQEKYLNLIETSTLGILEINLIENKIEYVNPALLDILESSLKEIKDENLFYKMVHPDDISNLMASREKKDIEFRILLKDGTTKWVAASRLYTYGINQQPINLRLWMTDVTARKKSEKLKEKFTEHLEIEVEYRTKDLKDILEKQRLYLDQIEKISRFKTEFLATMSHELRTPLNAIIGFTDLLIEGVFGELNKEQTEYIKDIDDSSNHLLDMITRILDISKIESGQATLKIEEIQLNNLITQVISTLKPLYIEKDIKWELVGLKKEQFIFADRIKFKQIIYNLLSNAIKFTKKGKIIFEFKENKYNWEFIIKDTGIGISENDFDIIFKDFKRVKSEYVEATQGTGLGLALTKRLVNIQGGDISFSSILKKGTTFTFNLPKTIKEKLVNIRKIESFLSKL